MCNMRTWQCCCTLPLLRKHGIQHTRMAAACRSGLWLHGSMMRWMWFGDFEVGIHNKEIWSAHVYTLLTPPFISLPFCKRTTSLFLSCSCPTAGKRRVVLSPLLFSLCCWAWSVSSLHYADMDNFLVIHGLQAGAQTISSPMTIAFVVESYLISM